MSRDLTWWRIVHPAFVCAFAVRRDDQGVVRIEQEAPIMYVWHGGSFEAFERWAHNQGAVVEPLL